MKKQHLRSSITKESIDGAINKEPPGDRLTDEPAATLCSKLSTITPDLLQQRQKGENPVQGPAINQNTGGNLKHAFTVILMPIVWIADGNYHSGDTVQIGEELMFHPP